VIGGLLTDHLVTIWLLTFSFLWFLSFGFLKALYRGDRAADDGKTVAAWILCGESLILMAMGQASGFRRR